MNFLIKILFFLSFTPQTQVFHSDSLNVGQWYKQWGWYFTDFKQQYGTAVFNVKMDGEFGETVWPAVWMINEYDCFASNQYNEVDFELFPGKAVMTVWTNPDSCTSDGIKPKRVTYHNKSSLIHSGLNLMKYQ